MDWSTAIRGFEAYLQLERALSENTCDAYRRDLRKLAQFCQMLPDRPGPLDVGSRQIDQFLAWLHELGLGARTQARILSALRAFFHYLVLEDLLADNPAGLVEGPRLLRKLPTVLSYAEIQAMLEAIDLSHPQGTRNRAMLETLYACGLRVSELVNLRQSNLFLDIGFIKVVGKGDKERVVPIGEEAVKHIELYLAGDRRATMHVKPGEEDVLFLNRRGHRLSRVMVFHVIRDLAKRAGIQKAVSPHTFRHSFATHLLEGGADLRAIQDMLGHESILTTEIYTQLDREFLRETLMQFHPRSGKS